MRPKVNTSRDQKIEKLYREDLLSLSEISDIYGISKQRIAQIIGKVDGKHYVQLRQNKLTNEMRNLRDQGYTTEQIMQEFGVTKQTVYRHAPTIKKTNIEKFLDNVEMGDDDKCWNWTGCLTTAGYGHFRDNGNLIYAHRFSWEYFKGKLSKEIHILHLCNNPRCCNPNHLVAGTHWVNMRHRDMAGHTNSKLDPEKVKKIRTDYISGKFTYSEIAKIYGVSDTTIRLVIQKKTFKWVD